jgi:hypothetical protein
MDADTGWHPAHFACLTTLFALQPDRYRRFWQAPIRYHGTSGTWRRPRPGTRLFLGLGAGLPLRAGLVPLPMSSYALSLRLLDSVGYWDSDVIADEWHMFIKAFFQRDGKIRLERVYLPFYGEATTGNGFWDSIKNRYQQSLRHAWGSKEVGYALARIIEHPEMEIKRGLRLFFRVAHDIILAGPGG